VYETGFWQNEAKKLNLSRDLVAFTYSGDRDLSFNLRAVKPTKASSSTRIFLGATLERQDDRREYGEVRIQAIGHVSDDILFVVYTDRGDVRHIISARLANRKERKVWQSFAEQWKISAG
jgi:hypothetical protein